MKISECHKAKLIKHSITGIHICPVCGYASPPINIVPKEWKRKTQYHDGREVYVYEPKRK